MKRPFVFINGAMSADGKISTIERKQVRISGTADLARVDALRAESDAIMVGVGTVLADDPSLRVKSDLLRRSRKKRGIPDNPLRVVADSRGKTPVDSRILGAGCLIAVSGSAPEENVLRLSERCQILVCGDDRVDLSGLLNRLYKMGVRRLMVEGGARLNWSLIKEGLVDELYVYVGAILIGGRDAPTLVDGAGFRADFPALELLGVDPLDSGVLLKWRIQK
ncbi:MAG: 2,5-diamino-6-(ribosylamino)-4(3H)-pyrimidinone 5'-phosphate reductase [Methanotrichaceae archaeon]|nr:2,5-diamino-6-(ribosylamino)-4(3H)-pyrimidinone 5'-phosphate reductase [Methanotrichaceae archaeon]